MGVPEGKRKESKIEFERAYDRIYDDCFELIRINFGGEKELVEIYSEQIRQIIVRIRRRLKKFRELYDLGKLSEIKIRNCYKSRIYSLMKECNRCSKSIKSLNTLYNELFPVKDKEEKKSRKELIYEIFKEEKELYEIYSTCRQ